MAAQLADFDLTRALLGLMVLGAAHRAMTTTIEWVRQREAFGAPIATYQGCRSRSPSGTPSSRRRAGCAIRTLGLGTAGLPDTREAAMCKWWAPRIAVQAINDCIVLHGHVGWSTEMPLQQLLLDVSGLQIGDVTPQIQKLVITRHLIGREHVG